MICHQTVKEVDIVFADGAEVEEFIYHSLLEGQLSETYVQIRSRQQTSGSRVVWTYTASSGLRMTPRAGVSDRRCGDICECMQGWQYRNLGHYTSNNESISITSFQIACTGGETYTGAA
jgi:hypothetical protein